MGTGAKLEKNTSDCIPSGNYLESQFRSTSQRNSRKTENTSWEIDLVSWDPLDQSLKSLWMSLNPLAISVLPAHMGQGQMFLEIRKAARYSNHERKLRWKWKTLFRLAIILNEIIPRELYLKNNNSKPKACLFLIQVE